MALFLSSAAIQHLTSLGKESWLRVQVKSGGCAGLQYVFSIETSKKDSDVVIEDQGAVVIVDPLSLHFIDGSTVHYHNELMMSYFTLENPKATAGCGCGTSFSVH